jgi:flagellar hook-basal body complex protein FliE
VNVGAIQGNVPIAPLDAPDWAVAAGSGVATTGGVGEVFGRLVTDGLTQVNGQLATSQVDLQRLATGDVQNLHQVMMRLEESRLSFQLLMQVRNRLLEAYQDVMKMQI